MDVLGIPVVLETVLQHLDTKSLTVSRLVNKSWNYEACKILEERVLIIFSTYAELKTYNECFDPAAVQNNVEISIGFQSFYFQSALFVAAVQDMAFRGLVLLKAAIQKFVEISGHQVTELRLCVFPLLPVVRNFAPPHPPEVVSDMYSEMVHMVYDYFPNLKHLKLFFLISIPGQTMSKGPDFREKLNVIERILLNLTTVSIDVNALEMDLGPNHPLANRPDGINAVGGVFEEDEEPATEDRQGLESMMVSHFIEALLMSAVHLQSISSQIPSQVPDKALHRYLFRTLPLISPSPYLHEINFRLKMSYVNLQYFCGTFNFPNLNKLILEIDTSTVKTTMGLVQLFEHIRSSVRELDLSFIKQTAKRYVELPRGVLMDSLLCLTLKNYYGSFNWEKFPALQKVNLENCSMQGFASSWIYCYPQGYLSDICTCPSRTSANSRGGNCFVCPPNSLTSLKIIRGTLERPKDFHTVFDDVVPYCFKFLNSLTLVNVPPSLLTPIFQECKKLKRLEVLRCPPDEDELDDQILCGLRESLLGRICPLEDPMNGYAVDQESIVKLVAYAKKRGKRSVREKAYIGNLKELEHLTLEGDYTDVGVLYGVIQCGKLKNLSLKSELCTWRTTCVVKVALKEVARFTFNGKRLNLTD